MNSSDARRFETAYRQLWGALHRGDEGELGQHERDLLHHIPPDGSASLGRLAEHLLLPKSTASVLVKDLERRGYLHRARDPHDERRLAIVLTDKGATVVREDTVLDVGALQRALRALPAAERRSLVEGIERLAATAERQGRT